MIKSRAASTVLYMGSFPPSGNRFGIRPSRSFTAKVRRMLFAVSYLPEMCIRDRVSDGVLTDFGRCREGKAISA